MIVVPVSKKEKRKMEEITSNHSKIAGDQELYFLFLFFFYKK